MSSHSTAPRTVSSSACYNDDVIIGPVVTGCRDDFDFTISFEDTFLCLVPSACFLVLALLRVIYLYGKPSLVNGRSLQGVKPTAVIVYIALQLCLLALTSKTTTTMRLGLSAAVLSLLDGLAFLILSVLEHARYKPVGA